MEWLQNVQNSGKPKKLLIELLFKRAELLASIKKMKIEVDSFRNIKQSKQSEEGAKSTLQEMATSSKTLIHEDVLQENVGFRLRETRIINFKVNNIPKLYGNDREKVDEWIYLVETEARTQGIIRSKLIDCVTKLLRGNALQMLRNMQKRDESVTWEKFKNQLLATLKPADVQRGLRSELKIWFFLEALDPRVRAELDSKNEETLNDAIRHARVFTKGLSNFSKPTDSFMKPSINGKEYVSKFRGQKFDHNGKEKFRSQNELKKNLVCFGCKKPEFASKEENKWILVEWKKLTFNQKVIVIKQKYPNLSIDNVNNHSVFLETSYEQPTTSNVKVITIKLFT
ncbi:hypothetical protein BpHYR1_047571 [Brachionus plicatilis]|uniref:Retrotransposon gag domain-containing protein n=1 Tax=Brachionus plicatilis TaxID=10195 RepID=A0A3M7SRN7_BRAPC|nr:hypothetical protein BpHYR1_047571 [Brachionus plicatilis]